MHKPTCRFLENSKNVKPHIIQHPEPLNDAPQTTKGVASRPARSKSPGQESCSSGDDAFSEASTTRNGPLTIMSCSASFDGKASFDQSADDASENNISDGDMSMYVEQSSSSTPRASASCSAGTIDRISISNLLC